MVSFRCSTNPVFELFLVIDSFTTGRIYNKDDELKKKQNNIIQKRISDQFSFWHDGAEVSASG